jgi:DNA-binding NtrC family response regulator
MEHWEAGTMQVILVMGDDADLRTSLTEALGGGYLVVAVGSGTEAARVLREQPVDVVLMDLVTCAADAFEVLGRARAMGRKPAVVLLEEHGQVARAVKMMRLGISDCLERTCGAEEVGKAVRALTSEGTAQTANAR